MAEAPGIDPRMAPFVDAMLDPEVLAGRLGIEAVDAAPGRARCEVTVRQQHLNQAAYAHGGLLFTLGDTAIGIASCRPGGPVPLGTSFTLQIVRSSRPGDRLSAEAVENHRGRTLVSQQVVIRRMSDDALVATLSAQLLLTAAGRAPADG